MRKSLVPQLAGAAILAGLALAGCQPGPRGSEEPMTTEGPNQVVIKVPGMT
jgi:hypothetical protein